MDFLKNIDTNTLIIASSATVIFIFLLLTIFYFMYQRYKRNTAMLHKNLRIGDRCKTWVTNEDIPPRIVTATVVTFVTHDIVVVRYVSPTIKTPTRKQYKKIRKEVQIKELKPI